MSAAERYDRAAIEAAVARASTTRQVLVEPGAMAETGRIVHALTGAGSALVVADGTTWRVAGEAVAQALAAAGIALVGPVIFPATPRLHADYDHVGPIREAIAAAPAGTIPVAVGSGTINDLTKRAAHEAGVPYLVVATAASMDGYTASGAALVQDGFKQTLPCDAPLAVIADPGLLADAPGEMTAAGYGDLIGKVTAGADWILADAAGIEPIQPDIWAMVQGPLRGAVDDPAALARGDREAIGALFNGLVMTGLAIQASGSSRPASGSEHQFSHLWEMRGLAVEGEEVSHGFKVAYGTLFSTRLYEAMLAREADGIDWDGTARCATRAAMEAEIARHIPDPEQAARALGEVRAKAPAPGALRTRLGAYRSHWDAVRERLRAHLIPSGTLAGMLRAAGCPTEPGEIGLTETQVQETVIAARLIRRRYTVLDAICELGVRDAAGITGDEGQR
jgi:glycerol-1-phosphate dehydrogenase [NAD(P)+]